MYLFYKTKRKFFMKLLIFISLQFFSTAKIFAQYKIIDSCSAFTLKIEAKNLHSDSLRFSYQDCDKRYIYDTLILSNGKAKITGKINRATEGILFTNIRGWLSDGPRVIRFIIEPNKMTLHFAIRNDTVGSVYIKGSLSQKQKETWEVDNSSILNAEDKFENENIKLIHQNGSKNIEELKSKQKIVRNQIEALRQSLITSALKYVKKNPNSFFSGYLLFHYKKNIPTDTLEKYFDYLNSNVTNSDFGKFTLEDLFKLTDDWVFRRKFADSSTYESLKKINNIYDVSLPNLEGVETNFSEFKGNLLLIDFWATGCGPCIKNVPYLKKLIAEMKNKPFKVISVSLDDNIGIWEKSIKKYGFPGIHLFDGGALLSTYYKVLWVPRYILVNSDGSVADIDAPQPMDSKLKIEINDLLKKNKQ